MKATIAVILASSAALYGCTRIIERPAPQASQPAVISTPAIVERERSTSSATGSSAPAACTWASQIYSSGAISCQDHASYRCNNGAWERQAGPSC